MQSSPASSPFRSKLNCFFFFGLHRVLLKMFSEVKKVQQMHRFFLVLISLIVQAPTFTEAFLLLSYEPPLYFFNKYK